MLTKSRQSSTSGLTRRKLLATGGLALAGVASGAAGLLAQSPPLVEIRMRSIGNGEHVAFDPIGVLVEPGSVIRWVIDADVHTTTAYHPRNDRHPLRIPRTAKPWDSGYLVNPGDSFRIKLTVEGVYDYFCAPHELAGMVGRIIVGRPTGPGSLAFDYHRGLASAADWGGVPEAAQKNFPTIEEIMKKRVVSLI